ncbi:MAG TPA: restriction endonuclease, partial [Candidatus Paceibacterota bacterium]|nr:restriction endonuclease [Candidatus Paceibacterota bacterium]
MSFIVAKADGKTEPFEAGKLTHSLVKAGAQADVARGIVEHIEKELAEHAHGQMMTTHEIYAHAFQELRSVHRPLAARYSLKRAVLDFGPSGFPFEEYIADLFRHEGYEAKTDQIIKGGCVEHEVDVVLTKDGVTTFVEAKFHNSLAYKSDLKVALYVKARIDDLRAAGHTTATGLLVTNTKFTDVAVQYAECQLLALLSWDYPQGSTLHERIERAKLYPITAITSLSRREKTALL